MSEITEEMNNQAITAYRNCEGNLETAMRAAIRAALASRPSPDRGRCTCGQSGHGNAHEPGCPLSDYRPVKSERQVHAGEAYGPSTLSDEQLANAASKASAAAENVQRDARIDPAVLREPCDAPLHRGGPYGGPNSASRRGEPAPASPDPRFPANVSGGPGDPSNTIPGEPAPEDWRYKDAGWAMPIAPEPKEEGK